uniref:BRICHOS domain-containing protein n=1 Tax=Steinernema glaseri TaxID=37863 RepID=A0A1I7Y3E6_9BILA
MRSHEFVRERCATHRLGRMEGTPSGCVALSTTRDITPTRQGVCHPRKGESMQSASSPGHINACTATVIALIIACASSLATLLLANYLYTGISCNSRHPKHYDAPQKRTVFDRNGRWDGSERMIIAEKNITVVRAHSSDRCYIVPLRLATDEKQLKQHVELIEEITSTTIFEKLAGVDAVNFCHDHRVFFMTDPPTKQSSRRHKRVAIDRNVDPQKLKYEERAPRCMDILLDCAGGKIGEVHSCFTWINGVMSMDRECLSETEFKVTLQKPKGRIIKIQKEQWDICKERRKEGLRC